MEPDGQRKVVAVNGIFNLEANVAMRIIHRYQKKKNTLSDTSATFIVFLSFFTCCGQYVPLSSLYYLDVYGLIHPVKSLVVTRNLWLVL
jgi:hypothetical protein